MRNTTRAELLLEINRAARRLGAKSDLIVLIGSWGDTLGDEDVLHGLQRWNDRLRPGLKREEATSIEVAIQWEIYLALERLGAPIDVLAPISGWGDIYDDAETLADLQRFNRTNSMVNHYDPVSNVPSQDNQPG